jgi:hypothetical protein
MGDMQDEIGDTVRRAGRGRGRDRVSSSGTWEQQDSNPHAGGPGLAFTLHGEGCFTLLAVGDTNAGFLEGYCAP